MFRRPSKLTAYADYVYKMVEGLLASGREGFTVKEFCAYSGLKPTGNLRRRLNHCVEAGTLEVQYVYVPGRGSRLFYSRPRKHLVEQELPF